MAMGRECVVQGDFMVTWKKISRSAGHLCYDGLQQLLATPASTLSLKRPARHIMRRRWALRRRRLAVISACI